MSSQKNEKKYQSVIFMLLICCLMISCEKPVEPIKIEPSRRDYIWTEDTLDIKLPNMLTYRYFVGNSPDDIWLGTLDASYDVSLWHYNGVKWASVYFPGYATTALWLCDDNTLWAATQGNIIWKRENGEWVESYKLKLEEYDDINIFDFHGKSKNDIYAVGWAIAYDRNDYIGVILHYNGTKWSFVDIPNLRSGFNQIVYDKNIDTYFIRGLNNDEGFLDKAFIFDKKNLKEIFSTYKDISLSEINGVAYIDSEKKIYKYRNNKLALWKDFSKTKFWTIIIGRNENDFISNGDDGVIHFNGLDFRTIYKTNFDLQAKFMIDKDIFIASEDYSGSERRYIIIHGKLKD